MFWYQSKFVGDRLRTLELSGDEDARFIKDTVFAKKISTYLGLFNHKDEKPKYPRNLPGNWTYSEIELFVSAQLLATMKVALYTTNFIGPLSYQAFSFLKLLALS